MSTSIGQAITNFENSRLKPYLQEPLPIQKAITNAWQVAGINIRTTYYGPLSLAEDYMVWNITKDDIRVRMAIYDEDVCPPPVTEKPQVPDPSLRIPYSDFIWGGKYDMKDVIQPTYDEINKEYGLNEKQDD